MHTGMLLFVAILLFGGSTSVLAQSPRNLGGVWKTADGGKPWSLQLDGLRAAQAMLAAATDDASRRAAQLFRDGREQI